MDLIIENSGLDLIGVKIFGYLSPKDLFKCCFVSKSWQHFIIENKKRFGCNIITSNLEELVEYLLQCTCRNYSDCQYDLNRYSRNNGRSFSVRLNHEFGNCSKCKSSADILPKVFNIEELLLKAVINGWVEFFKYLFPYAKKEGIDFDSPLPTIQQEPFNKRPLLHNLVCTEHCNRDLLVILMDLDIDVFRKDGNGCTTMELVYSQIPIDIRIAKGLTTVPNFNNMTEFWSVNSLYLYSDFLKTKNDYFLNQIIDRLLHLVWLEGRSSDSLKFDS